MKLIKLSLAAAVVASIAFAQDTKSDVGVSANVALTSNYVWRGMSQSDDSPAVQGGFDVDYKGLYAGVWGSNVEFGSTSDANLELDTYAGYTNDIFGVGYDIGYLQYIYPNDSKNLNFGEAYLGLSYDFKVLEISAKYSLGVNTDNTDTADEWKPQDCIEGGVSVPLPWDLSIDATVGNYVHSGVYYIGSVTKSIGNFDLSLAYTGIDYDDSSKDDDANVVATISASF